MDDRADDFYRKIATASAILAGICLLIWVISALVGTPLPMMLKASGVFTLLAIAFFLLIG
jgi:hypothetical protein